MMAEFIDWYERPKEAPVCTVSANTRLNHLKNVSDLLHMASSLVSKMQFSEECIHYYTAAETCASYAVRACALDVDGCYHVMKAYANENATDFLWGTGDAAAKSSKYSACYQQRCNSSDVTYTNDVYKNTTFCTHGGGEKSYASNGVDRDHNLKMAPFGLRCSEVLSKK